ncbi:MAG: hypothetical protein ACI9ON_003564, partial [Limisphaerales bacterium]
RLGFNGAMSNASPNALGDRIIKNVLSGRVLATSVRAMF